MYKISLKNNINFSCSENDTLIEGARKSGIILEHSCLTGRCSSCKVKVGNGVSEETISEIALTQEEIDEGYILSCIRVPKSDMHIEAEDLSDYSISAPRTYPAKIRSILRLTKDVIRVELRLPPNQVFNFIPGQYINVIKGNIKRSYSIGNSPNKDSVIELLIKNYPGGQLSEYWFSKAKINDLLRIEGPRGTFFLRKSGAYKNIIFLATGTGIAPVKSILETIATSPLAYVDKEIYLFWGGRFLTDLFWTPENIGLDINYYPVLSREKNPTTDEGYVQQILIDKNIELNDSMVYACGSNKMIQDSKNILLAKGLPVSNFFSDAFVTSN
jgi:CDP-4-dehydro-6-deoxyglucose reductase, E3